LIELAVINSMEQIVGEDPLDEFQTGAAAMDECANIGEINMHCFSESAQVVIVEGMDECDTAAVKFNCAKNKEPEMITNMIMNSELNSTAV
jgi:hypothetical protein